MAGKTSNFYNKPGNKDHKLKHIRDNSPGGKYAHSKAYKREHARARRKAGLMGKGGPDMSKKNGKFVKEDLKINRARGGRDRA